MAQGIQKGIELYKKQQKAKARELDKQKKRASKPNTEIQAELSLDNNKQLKLANYLPWILLLLSWAGFAGYILA